MKDMKEIIKTQGNALKYCKKNLKIMISGLKKVDGSGRYTTVIQDLEFIASQI